MPKQHYQVLVDQSWTTISGEPEEDQRCRVRINVGKKFGYREFVYSSKLTAATRPTKLSLYEFRQRLTIKERENLEGSSIKRVKAALRDLSSMATVDIDDSSLADLLARFSPIITAERALEILV